jgi:hypothetical protein
MSAGQTNSKLGAARTRGSKGATERSDGAGTRTQGETRLWKDDDSRAHGEYRSPFALKAMRPLRPSNDEASIVACMLRPVIGRPRAFSLRE